MRSVPEFQESAVRKQTLQLWIHHLTRGFITVFLLFCGVSLIYVYALFNVGGWLEELTLLLVNILLPIGFMMVFTTLMLLTIQGGQNLYSKLRKSTRKSKEKAKRESTHSDDHLKQIENRLAGQTGSDQYTLAQLLHHESQESQSNV